MQAEREVPLLMQRKPVATLNEYTGKPVMKSAHWAYESAAGGFPSVRPPKVAAHEIPPDGGTKAALCAAYSAFTNVKTELANPDLSMIGWLYQRVLINLVQFIAGVEIQNTHPGHI